MLQNLERRLTSHACYRRYGSERLLNLEAGAGNRRASIIIYADLVLRTYLIIRFLIFINSNASFLIFFVSRLEFACAQMSLGFFEALPGQATISTTQRYFARDFWRKVGRAWVPAICTMTLRRREPMICAFLLCLFVATRCR
ncbi:hypothetical protein KCU59_g41, partial [Aureobasidium melanogenum]